jgi:hypothetical protein
MCRNYVQLIKRRKHFYKHIIINVRSAEVLQIDGKERNVVQATQRRKANWNCHIFHTNCLLKHVIGGKIDGRIEVARRRGRRSKVLIDNLKK